MYSLTYYFPILIIMKKCYGKNILDLKIKNNAKLPPEQLKCFMDTWLKSLENIKGYIFISFWFFFFIREPFLR